MSGTAQSADHDTVTTHADIHIMTTLDAAAEPSWKRNALADIITHDFDHVQLSNPFVAAASTQYSTFWGFEDILIYTSNDQRLRPTSEDPLMDTM